MRSAELHRDRFRFAHRVQRLALQNRLYVCSITDRHATHHYPICNTAVARDRATDWQLVWPVRVAAKVHTVAKTFGLVDSEVEPNLLHCSCKFRNGLEHKC